MAMQKERRSSATNATGLISSEIRFKRILEACNVMLMHRNLIPMAQALE